MFRELGPKYDIIDVRVADRKIGFDIPNGEWNTGTILSINYASYLTNCLSSFFFVNIKLVQRVSAEQDQVVLRKRFANKSKSYKKKIIC